MAIYEADGLYDGYTLPLCVPGEPRGFCSFGYANPDDLTLDVMAIINLAGAMLFESARRARAAEVAQSRAGTLTVGFSPGLAAGPLQWGIAAFVAAFPDVHLKLVESTQGDLHRRLIEGPSTY